ncbi:DUF4129 domain-containing protein [Planktothricoides sp. FACHB-1370]|uniref:DUF4129 domain-containing protein n=2 Tax=Planktothricoides raciborskii TaxID=132608 RepID=A0ABR8EHX6_9CYAN|nr:DUF4129 domain-containing protein [Planktothricoides raciborskii FACHB-1370]MBD2584021.1 DUF4129 domain-containing protein [Planktothricoides raciborskii FACHB-1261]
MIMSVAEFETTNLSWRWQQGQQQLQEWTELKFSQFFPNLFPSLDWPTVPTGNFNWLFYVLGIVLTIAVCWQLQSWIVQFWYWQMSKTSDRRSHFSENRSLTVKDLLGRSRKYQEKGNYTAACYCLYRAMLQQLDDRGIIPQQVSRTDREYDQLLQEQPNYSAYKVLLETHERLYFGKQQANADMFARCQEAYEAIVQK